jgi:drug/metabolite transporter (DMT)-like permease
LFGSLSCIFQGASFELGKRLVEHQGSLWSVLMLNSLVSTALQFVTIVVTNELPALSPSSMTPLMLFHLILNSCLVMVMNYFIFLNCSVNSPLAHAVTGNIKAVLTVAAGIVLFSTPISGMGYIGLVISFGGGGWFSSVKLNEAKNAKAKKKQDEIV